MTILNKETQQKITGLRKFVRDGNNIAFGPDEYLPHVDIARQDNLGEPVPGDYYSRTLSDAGYVLNQKGKFFFYGTTMGCRLRSEWRIAREETKRIASTTLGEEVTVDL